jgi:hypothetical protein
MPYLCHRPGDPTPPGKRYPLVDPPRQQSLPQIARQVKTVQRQCLALGRHQHDATSHAAAVRTVRGAVPVFTAPLRSLPAFPPLSHAPRATTASPGPGAVVMGGIHPCRAVCAVVIPPAKGQRGQHTDGYGRCNPVTASAV